MEEFKVPNAVPKLDTKPLQEKQPVGVDPIENKSTQENAHHHPTKPIPSCPYIEPKWSGCPLKEFEYKFEVLKTGQIIDEVKNLQEKAFWVFGRSPGNDIEMAHPTVSRFHAIFQYRPKLESDDTAENKKHIEEGWYIYDMGSTHGTFLNKMRIPPKAYIRVKVGHMLRLGASMRSYILQGPDFDQEPESEMSVTELKQMRVNADEQKKVNASIQLEAMEREDITWGMGEDADEESDLSVNPYASTNNEELFLDDPKKTLRGYFEREGLDLEYKCDEMSIGTFVCRIELPVDDLNGKRIVAEVCHKGKKKDCVVQGALEACRILDRHGVLRQANHEPLKRKITKADSDDEDDFFDRTGDVERKKMRKSNPSTSVTLTYDDLLIQETEIKEKLNQVKTKVEEYHELARQVKESKKQQIEDLDTFMENLTDAETILEKSDLWKLQMEEKQLQTDYNKLKRLIQIAKPIDLPAIISADAETNRKPRQLPLIGKRNQFVYKTLPSRVPTTTTLVEKELRSDEEEVEVDVEEEEEKKVEEKELEEKSVDKSVPKEEQPVEKVTKDSKETQKTKLYGPAYIPNEILSPNVTQEIIQPEEEQKIEDEQKMDENPTPESEQASNNDAATTSAAKKKRSRQRVRGKRENIDIDDQGENEDIEKYSKWVPPENQSGDGITSLNDKFGY